MPQRATIERVCLECLSAFMARPSQVRKGSALYCSVHCAALNSWLARRNKKSPPTGEQHNNWRGGAYQASKRYTLANPLIREAHLRVRSALKSGHLVRPSSCSECGVASPRIEAHHWDYSQPLSVVWLCKSCHELADALRRNHEASSVDPSRAAVVSRPRGGRAASRRASVSLSSAESLTEASHAR